MLMKTFKKRKLEITANASYMSAPIEAKHFPKPIDFTINNVEYHLAEYVDYTGATANLVHEPILLNGATSHSVVEGAVYTFYGESVLVESENLWSASNQLGYSEATIHLKQGTYTLSFDTINATTWRYKFICNQSDMSYSGGYYNSNGYYLTGENISVKNTSFEVLNECDIAICLAFGDTASTTIATKTMLNIGTTALPYTPYFEPYIKNKGIKNPFTTEIIQKASYGNYAYNKATGTISNNELTYTRTGTNDYSDISCSVNIPTGQKLYLFRLTTSDISKIKTNFPCIILDSGSGAWNYFKTKISKGNYHYFYRIIDGDGNRARIRIDTEYTTPVGFECKVKLFSTTNVDLINNIESYIDNLDIPADGNYYLAMGNTLFNIGTSPLIEGNTYSTNGVGKQSSGRVDLGSLNYELLYNNSDGRVLTRNLKNVIKTIASEEVVPNLKCAKYEKKAYVNRASYTIGISQDTSGNVIVKDSNFLGKTLEQIVALLSGIYLEYDLATATTSVDQAYECDNGMVGEHPNLWNECWIVGGYANGTYYSTNNTIASKDYIKVNSNSQYYFTRYLYVSEYDSNKTFIQRTFVWNNVLTTSNTTKYILFNTSGDYGTTYNRDIAIYEGSTARAYTPHIADEVATHYLHCDKVEQVKVKSTTNKWDEIWESGGFNYANGSTNTENAIRSVNYIKVNPNTTYYCCGNLRLYAYNINKEYIGCYTGGEFSTLGRSPIQNQTITMPSNCYYLKLQSAPTYGTTFNYDIAIVEGTTNTYYNVSTQPNKYLPIGEVQNNLHSSEVTCVKVDNATKYAQCKAKSSPQFNFDTEAIDLLTTTLQNEYFSVNECLCIYAEPSTTPITTPSTKTMQAPQSVEIVGKQLSVKVAQQR